MAVARLLHRPSIRHLARDKGLASTQVLALANQKGGVAKTTTTLNLGVAFRERGLRVLCIDLDPQGNLTMSQGMNPDTIERSMFDVLVHRMPISEVIEPREVDIAVASIDLAGADMALSSQIGRERALQKALDPIKDRYDYILIDTPPSLGLLTINAFVAADRRDRPGPDRVPVAARPRPAREHAADGAGEPEPAGRDHRHPADDVRQAAHALARGRRDPARELRRPGLQHANPEDDPLRGGAGEGARRSSPTSRMARLPRSTATSRRRCSVARNRASMREGPLAELFRATEAAQRKAERRAAGRAAPASELEATPGHAAPTPSGRKRHRRRCRPAGATACRAAAAEPERPAARWLEPLPENPARLERARESTSYLAVIRVVGVGGAGLNALDRMMDAGITQVDFVAVNTDIQQLQMSDAPTKLHIGSELTEGLGSGADPEIGRRAAEEAYDQLKRTLRGSDMVFVTAGEGGGTGSGAAPVVARIARELGALTVGIVTTPFKFEGTRRDEAGRRGRRAAPRRRATRVIVIPNDRLLEVLDKSTSMLDAFRIADDVLRQGVQGICDLITNPGLINLDFADVRTIMKDAGSALMGIGFATGENRAPRGGRARARQPADRRRRSPARAASCSRSPAATTCRSSRSTRRPRWSARRRPTTRTSSSARRSTSGSPARSGSPSSRPASAAPRRRGRSRRAGSRAHGDAVRHALVPARSERRARTHG